MGRGSEKAFFGQKLSKQESKILEIAIQDLEHRHDALETGSKNRNRGKIQIFDTGTEKDNFFFEVNIFLENK